jgi:hypothetical protein
MTITRVLALYLAAGAVVTALLATADGERGLRAGAVAWAVCLVPLLRWPPRRVAAAGRGPRIAGKWGLLQTGAMLFRLAWVLGAGAVLYGYAGDRLGGGFWIALLVFYQVMLALSVVRLLRRGAPGAPAGRPASHEDWTSDAPG